MLWKYSGSDCSLIWKKGYAAHFDPSLGSSINKFPCVTAVSALRYNPGFSQLWGLFDTQYSAHDLSFSTVLPTLCSVDVYSGLMQTVVTNYSFPTTFSLYAGTTANGRIQSRAIDNDGNNGVYTLGGDLPTATSKVNQGKNPKILRINQSGGLQVGFTPLAITELPQQVTFPASVFSLNKNTPYQFFAYLSAINPYLINNLDISGSTNAIQAIRYGATGVKVCTVDTTHAGQVIAQMLTTGNGEMVSNSGTKYQQGSGAFTSNVVSPTVNFVFTVVNRQYNVSPLGPFSDMVLRGTAPLHSSDPALLFWSPIANTFTIVVYTLVEATYAYLFARDSSGDNYMLEWKGVNNGVDNTITKFDKTTGNQIWRQNFIAQGIDHTPTTLLVDLDNNFYVC